MAVNEQNITQARTLQSQLAAMDVSDAASHRDIVVKCQSLINNLQDQGDKATETFMSFLNFGCLSVINALGIFEKLSKGPLTARQLAEQCGANHLLIVRLMRVVTSSGVVLETGPESYAPTGASNLLAQPGFKAAFRISDRLMDKVIRFPGYFKESNYGSLPSTSDGPFQHCFGTELTCFQWLAQNPEVGNDFNIYMVSQRSQQHWTETFSAKEAIFGGVEINPSAPLVVDVGGGYGHDLRILKDKLPSVAKGQLVLEEQGFVIDTIPKDLQDGDITYVKYDFFKPQHITGARVYTMKSILHDWSDDKALEILRNVASGMTPGYSKVWILEGIVPETNASKALVSLDMMMMTFLGSLERTKAQWYGLLEKAGLKVVNLATRPDGFGVIEAMVMG